MSAHLVYVVGPSGAGKDTLLHWLRSQLPDNAPLHWVRRTITRPADAGGENHESVSPDQFRQILSQQGFAMHWDANGLQYGIRHEQLTPLQRQQWVFVNGSRANLAQAAQQFPGMVILHITASTEVLKQRLLQRGREPTDNLEARMRRAIEPQWPADCPRVDITNDGSLDASGVRLLRKMQQLPDWPVPLPEQAQGMSPTRS